jgi:riboflavin kinase/FMN adenylyltransferase
MRVFRSLGEIGPDAPPSAVSIGNFDGVHIAHQKIFCRSLEIGQQYKLVPSVLTFDPHPTKVVAPARAPKLLTTPEDRIGQMTLAGIEQVFLLPFDRTFSQQTPEEFVQHVLVNGLKARAVLVGDNFRFGKAQSGDVKTLAELGTRFGFHTEIVSGVRVRGHVVSSSEIRRLVETGEVGRACRLLGRPYSIAGQVVTGHGIGSKQTVPTLNLATSAEVLPAIGVYVTRTHDLHDNRSWDSITNIGFRPTFGGDALSIETYLLSPFDGSRPEEIKLEFLRRVREERKFDSPELLKAQILRDVGRASAYFRRRRAFLR